MLTLWKLLLVGLLPLDNSLQMLWKNTIKGNSCISNLSNHSQTRLHTRNSGTYVTYGKSIYKPGIEYREVSRWECCHLFAPVKGVKHLSVLARPLLMPCGCPQFLVWIHTRDGTLCSGWASSSPEPFYPRRRGHKDSALKALLEKQGATLISWWDAGKSIVLQKNTFLPNFILSAKQRESSWNGIPC